MPPQPGTTRRAVTGPGRAAAATAVPPAAAAAAAAAVPEDGGGLWNSVGSIMRGVLLYLFVSNLVTWYRGGSNQAPAAVNDARGNPAAVPHYANAWRDAQPFDLYLYIDTDPQLRQLDGNATGDSDLAWHVEGLTYDTQPHNYHAGHNYTLPQSYVQHLKANGSLFAHAILAEHNAPIWLTQDNFQRQRVIYATKQLNSYRPALKLQKRKNLLSGDAGDSNESAGELIEQVRVADTDEPAALSQLPSLVDDAENSSDGAIPTDHNTSSVISIVNFWLPQLTLRLVHDFTPFTHQLLTPDIINSVQLNSSTKTYQPVVYWNEFWTLTSHYQVINQTTESLSLEMAYAPISMWAWRLQSQMDTQWKSQQQWGQSTDDTDIMKRMFLESNPYLLAVTMVVSILHSLFDFLAFKNDVQFWRSETKGVGLSRGSIVLNVVCQFIIFLYLLDNETSWLIIGSTGVGLLIEIWKVTRAMNVNFDAVYPYLHLKMKNLGNEDEDAVDDEQQLLRDTAKYDTEAMKYMSYALYPLVIGYSIYALIYETHKSWYSWILNSLVGAVYTFGFIGLCPQLYLNYKLKSVAHMPWRQMTYKFFNTIIDDLFAFVIAMPTLHRIAVFRDDIVFLLFLYQRWVYRVDYSRVNEFGLALSEEQQKKLQIEEEEAKNSKTEHHNLPSVPSPPPQSTSAEIQGILTSSSDGSGLHHRTTNNITPM